VSGCSKGNRPQGRSHKEIGAHNISVSESSRDSKVSFEGYQRGPSSKMLGLDDRNDRVFDMVSDVFSTWIFPYQHFLGVLI
jgi:hypothetical protein